MRSSLSVLGVPSTLLSAQHRIDGEMRAGWDAVNTHLPSPVLPHFQAINLAPYKRI